MYVTVRIRVRMFGICAYLLNFEASSFPFPSYFIYMYLHVALDLITLKIKIFLVAFVYVSDEIID